MSTLSHRKATANLTLVRADGTPLANSSVTVKQASHQFLFGCGAFDSVALMHAQKKGDEKAIAFLKDLQKLLKKHPDVYSLVTRAREDGKMYFELDVVSDFGDPDDWFSRLHTPLTVEIEPYKCSNIYNHTIDWIVEQMEQGHHYLINPMESERHLDDEDEAIS